MKQFEHWLWRDEPRAAGDAVLFDLDGVLADATGRQHLLQQSPPDWPGFFDLAGEDPLIAASAEILADVDASLAVILLTGRPLRIREITVDWLARHNVRWDLLIMRNQGNYGKAGEFKRDTVRQLQEDGWKIQTAYEDDKMICEILEEEGVPCVYVESGYYEHRAKRFPANRTEAGE